MAKTPKKTESKAEAPVPAPSADPWAPLDTLRREVDRLFDDFGPGAWRFPLRRPAGFEMTLPRAREWALAPAVDMVEKPKAYEVSVELPGMSEKDIEVKLANGRLTIKGEKKEETEEHEKEYHVSERRYGAFQRTFPVPDDVDPDKIDATFREGVLKVALPKSEQAQKEERKINVKAGK